MNDLLFMRNKWNLHKRNQFGCEQSEFSLLIQIGYVKINNPNILGYIYYTPQNPPSLGGFFYLPTLRISKHLYAFPDNKPDDYSNYVFPHKV